MMFLSYVSYNLTYDIFPFKLIVGIVWKPSRPDLDQGVKQVFRLAEAR